ncbi:MAG TPA: trigger factor [Acidimicrobiales bacterium]|nr:trigger factor [Acidimicrobiales bacterium]
MRATSEAVEGNRVRLSVEVDEAEVDDVIGEAIRTLSRQARVPGFRPGKVPRQVLEARMGGAVALRTEALREAIPDFYARALADAEIDPISAPEIDITSGQEAGALAFDAVVQVRPTVPIPGYAGLKVVVPSPTVSEADVDAQVDRLRDTDAELVEVDRPARDGDHVTIDVHGTLPDGEEVVAADDLLYEVGSGRIAEALDEQLRGAKVGDVLAFSATVPSGSTREERDVSFRVLLKDVKEKKLPPVTDEWAAEASEFSTVDELRADLRQRMARVKMVQAQLAFRQAALTALAELVEDDQVPDVLVDEELRQRLHDFEHRLGQQGISAGQFLELTGQSEEELLGAMRAEAREAVKSDLALRSIAEEESIEVTDEELGSEVAAMASRLQLEPAVVRERLTRAGRIAAVRSEQRKAKALTWLLDNVEVVDEGGAAVSRDDLKVDQSAEATASGGGPEEGVGGIGDGTAEDASGRAATDADADVTNGEIEA